MRRLELYLMGVVLVALLMVGCGRDKSTPTSISSQPGVITIIGTVASISDTPPTVTITKDDGAAVELKRPPTGIVKEIDSKLMVGAKVTVAYTSINGNNVIATVK